MDWLYEALQGVCPGVHEALGTGVDGLLPLVSQVFFGLCTFLFGAMVGSFLNVVVYRLPRGLSPAVGRSHCPACGVQILAKDNIPVFSWVLLRGRCRACAAPISPRYPIVEASCGLMFLALAFVEVVAADPARGSWWMPSDARPELVARFAYHAFGACMLLAWWLIEADGGGVPWRHAAVVLVIAVVLPIACPSLHPVAADDGFVWPAAFGFPSGAAARPPAAREWFDRGFLVSLLGAAAAVMLEAGFERLRGASRASALGFVLVGVVLGWQGTLWAAVGVALVVTASRLFAVKIR